MKNDNLMASCMPETASEMQAKRARAWKPEQVPIGALFRKYGEEHNPEFKILSVTPNFKGIGDVINYGVTDDITKPDYYYLTDLATCVYPSLYSTDGGKTWKPCYNE